MDIVIVTDIYGLTPHVQSIAEALSPPFDRVITIDPYGGLLTDFASEEEAYKCFMKSCGVKRLSELAESAIRSAGTEVVTLGFSVGASALWTLAEKEISGKTIKNVCFYGSRIREKGHIEPQSETLLLFPCSEDHYDVDELAASLSGRKNIVCVKTGFFHGFMNEKSRNFSDEGFGIHMDWLKRTVSRCFP